MRTTQRFLGVFIVLIMFLASMGNAAMAQDQGNQSDTTTQTGGGNVAPPMNNNNPDPAPAPQPEPSQPPAPQPSNPPASQPSAPSNGAQGGSQSGTSNSSGSQAPEGLAPRPQPQSPPPSTGGGSGPISVTVDLSSQMIYIYQGDSLLDSTLVRTGKAGFETPTGTFYINSKYRYDDMAGNERNESWDVPDVPYAMYFTGYGHALHGVYWSSAWGTPGSHGCVGMPVGFAGWLFSIAPIGTRVSVQW